MPIHIDSRGKGEKEIADLLIAKHYPVEVIHIESGDIVINGDIGIERKTVSDLISTLYSKQKGHDLWTQIEILKKTYKKSLVLLEGYINWEDKLLNSVIFGIEVGWQIPIIFTSNINDSIKRIGNIFDKYGCTKTFKIPPPAVKKMKTPKQIKWAMLQCVYHVGGTVATRILEVYPNILSIPDYFKYTQGKNYDFVKDKLNKVKGLQKESKELLIKVLCNE